VEVFGKGKGAAPPRYRTCRGAGIDAGWASRPALSLSPHSCWSCWTC